MAVRIQARRDTAANWSSVNPTLGSGEFGVETDTLKLKVGNGTLAWNSLPYVVGEAAGGGGDGVHEIATGNTSGTVNLDLDNHKTVNVYGTLTGNITLTFSRVPSGVATVTYVVAQNSTGGYSITYPGGTQYLNGSDGSINQAANAISVVSFITRNGGTTWSVAIADTRLNVYDAFYANPQENGDVYYVFDTAHTLNLGAIRTAGTGSVTAARRAAGGGTFTNSSTSTVFSPGDVLRLRTSGFSGWFTLTIPRIS